MPVRTPGTHPQSPRLAVTAGRNAAGSVVDCPSQAEPVDRRRHPARRGGARHFIHPSRPSAGPPGAFWPRTMTCTRRNLDT